MNEYVFYTTEGETIPPNAYVTVNNCQILGFAKGVDKQCALKTLLIDNKWIEDCGYNTDEIKCVQIVR